MRCVSFCTTESYKLFPIAAHFRNLGYSVKQSRKVLHIAKPGKRGDIFIFGYGCMITWELRNNEEKNILEQLKPFSISPLPNIEIARYVYRLGKRTSMVTHDRFNIDIIHHHVDGIVVCHIRVDAIGGESSAQAIPPLLHQAKGLNNVAPVHPFAVFIDKPYETASTGIPRVTISLVVVNHGSLSHPFV